MGFSLLPGSPMSSPASIPPSSSQDMAKPASRRTVWRFGLRHMLAAITVFAVWCGMVSTLPVAFSQMLVGMAWIAASGWLLTGIVFGKGDQRAFCIGAVVVVSSMWTGIGGRFVQGSFESLSLILGGVRFPRSLKVWLDLLFLSAMAAGNGYLCIRARRYFEQESC